MQFRAKPIRIWKEVLTISALLLAPFALAAPQPQSKPLYLRQSPVPNLDLGYFAYIHGNAFTAWPTPTTLQDACTTHSSVRFLNTATLSGPICGSPFTTNGSRNLTLTCGPPPHPEGENDNVVAVVDQASGTTIQSCSPVPSPETAECSGDTTLTRSFHCQCA